MKAKLELEFDTNEPDDTERLKSIVSNESAAWKSLLFDLDNHLRSIVKYSDDSVHDEYVRCAEETRTKIYDLLREENLSIMD